MDLHAVHATLALLIKKLKRIQMHQLEVCSFEKIISLLMNVVNKKKSFILNFHFTIQFFVLILKFSLLSHKSNLFYALVVIIYLYFLCIFLKTDFI